MTKDEEELLALEIEENSPLIKAQLHNAILKAVTDAIESGVVKVESVEDLERIIEIDKAIGTF